MALTTAVRKSRGRIGPQRRRYASTHSSGSSQLFMTLYTLNGVKVKDLDIAEIVLVMSLMVALHHQFMGPL